MSFNEEYEPIVIEDELGYEEGLMESSDMSLQDRRRPHHFQDVKSPGEVRHRGKPGFNAGHHHEMRMNPRHPHLNTNQPYVPHISLIGADIRYQDACKKMRLC